MKKLTYLLSLGFVAPACLFGAGDSEEETKEKKPPVFAKGKEHLIEQLNAIMAKAKITPYGEEGEITLMDHSLQCAKLARDSGAEEEMIIAALLHDIGMAIDADSNKSHEILGAEALESAGFSPKICELVRDHVNAKHYIENAMTDEEKVAFQNDPLFADKVQLRAWDNSAQTVDGEVYTFETYVPILEAHVNAQNSEIVEASAE